MTQNKSAKVGGSTNVPQIIFSNISEPEKILLKEEFKKNGLNNYLGVNRKRQDPHAHGELLTTAVAITAAKIVLPVIVAWLLQNAPPRVIKKKIVVVEKDGTKTFTEIEYSNSTSIMEMTERLSKIFDRILP